MFEDLIPLTDSRSLSDAPRTVFFALRTATGDGHRFIPELYRRGVMHFVVDNDYPTPAAETDFAEATFLRVASPLAALQTYASLRRDSFDGKS